MDLSISSSNQESPDMPQALPQLDSPTGIMPFGTSDEGHGGQDKLHALNHTSFKASAEATLQSPAEAEDPGAGAFNFEVVPPPPPAPSDDDDLIEEVEVVSSPDEIPQPLPDVVPKQIPVVRGIGKRRDRIPD